MRHAARVAGLALLSLATPLAGACAQQAEGYFKGKQFNIMIGGTAGGGIDLGARLLSRYIGKHLPGNPVAAPQLMPGAGGIRLLEHLAIAAPKDGTQIGAFATGPLLEPMIGGRTLSYKMTDLVAIGALEKDVSFCATWHGSPVKTVQDAMKRETTVAGTGAGSSTDIEPMVMNALMGTKFKVISGYVGTQETVLAVERGEVDGRCAFGWGSLNASKPDWLPTKKVNVLVQIGLQKHPKLPDVPLAVDLVTSPEDKQMMQVLATPLSLSRPYLAPPGLPADVTAMIRKAFMEAMAEEGLKAEFRKMTGEDPEPTEGGEMQKLIAAMYDTPPHIAARLTKIVNQK
ncbi:MAG: uncharacterized protein JWN93_2669 [Hyphomicrobiales bacterium]|nr:uncharacterized protein [Hyphomicrobiales bacterium]